MSALLKLFIARNIFKKRSNNALILSEIFKAFLVTVVDFRQILLKQIK